MEGAKIKHNRDSCIDVILGVQGVRVPRLSRVGGYCTTTFKCYKRPSFELKLRRNAWAAGALPRPRWGSLQHPQTP